VLQTIRFLLIRSKCFRLERDLAGPDFNRGEQYALKQDAHNNICERALKRAVLHRKNALFYKTLNGAEAGDLFMSLIHTCELCGAV
jgi:Transposase IS66 family